MDDGKPPVPEPPWGWGDAPEPAVLALPPPVPKPKKYVTDHGKATAGERNRRFHANKKAERQMKAVMGAAHELLPRPKTPRERAMENLNKAGRWQPGQSGNPKGMQGARLYIEAQRICRDASPDAARRMVELMGDPDTRVAYMATNMIMERAWGKPREYDPAADPENQVRIDVRRLTDEERTTLRKLMQQATSVGGAPTESEGGQE